MYCDIHLSHEEAKLNHSHWKYCPFCGAKLDEPVGEEILVYSKTFGPLRKIRIHRSMK
jgi:hypothetical protein